MTFKRFIKYAPVILAFSLVGCRSDIEKKLQGKWFAAQLIECEDIVPIEREKVNLEITSGGKYIFNSTLNVHEEGNYQVKDSFLLTHDQIREGATPKTVKIAYINSDTLQILMKYKGKDQLLTLLRDAPENRSNIVEVTPKVVTDTAQNNVVVPAVAATAGFAAAAIANPPAKVEEKMEEKKEEKKVEKETPGDRRQREKEEADRKKEKEKREKAKAAFEKKQKEEERKDREREKEKREKAAKKKKK